MAAVKTSTRKANTAPAADTVTISADELAQRVAIVRRFRELLIQQRERFHNYLAVLEKQQDVIKTGSAEELLAQVELEEQIVADIFSIQKVIDPLEDMYRTTVPFSPADDVPALKVALESLKNRAISQFAYNKDLLSSRMAELRTEIKELKNNPFVGAARSLYQNSVTASLVDIEG
ncbi:MAG: flagellar biosynthesis protein FlgN [Treponema sp.]|jgi:hypothetical protein|nr:flagellar biosynthesis protein FlgN [Treponema sp.]